VITFTRMAEEWMRENMTLGAVSCWAATESTPCTSEQDPAAWLEDFQQWIDANCIHRQGKDDWTGIGALHVDFCEWTVKNDSVPCQRRAFERLLVEAGFQFSHGMVGGLLLKRDLEGHLSFERPTESVETAHISVPATSS
jgi:hypothetical protein